MQLHKIYKALIFIARFHMRIMDNVEYLPFNFILFYTNRKIFQYLKALPLNSRVLSILLSSFKSYIKYYALQSIHI